MEKRRTCPACGLPIFKYAPDNKIYCDSDCQRRHYKNLHKSKAKIEQEKLEAQKKQEAKEKMKHHFEKIKDCEPVFFHKKKEKIDRPWWW